MITVQYHNDEERNQLLQQYSGMFLIRDDFTFDGMFLTFDVSPIPKDSLDIVSKVNSLDQRQKNTEQAIDFLLMNGGM